MISDRGVYRSVRFGFVQKNVYRKTEPNSTNRNRPNFNKNRNRKFEFGFGSGDFGYVRLKPSAH